MVVEPSISTANLGSAPALTAAAHTGTVKISPKAKVQALARGVTRPTIAKSQRTRPGSRRKQAALEKGERERFGRNLAALAFMPPESEARGVGLSREMEVEGKVASGDEPGGEVVMDESQDESGGTTGQGTGSEAKWAALRRYISLSAAS